MAQTLHTLKVKNVFLASTYVLCFYGFLLVLMYYITALYSTLVVSLISALNWDWQKSLFLFQIPMGRLRGWGAAERLPRHRVPALPAGWDSVAGRRALRALHGWAWRLRRLPSPVLRPDALGMRPSVCPARTREVFREVPALHSVHSGKRIPTGRELLLYLWVHLSCKWKCKPPKNWFFWQIEQDLKMQHAVV